MLRGSGGATTEHISPFWKMLYKPSSEKCLSGRWVGWKPLSGDSMRETQSLPNIAARRQLLATMEEYLALSAAVDVGLSAVTCLE